MSYDLLVWDGPRPDNAQDLRDTLDKIGERHARDRKPDAPSATIAEFVAALLRRWPDVEVPGSPWAASGTGHADGSILDVHIRWGREHEVSEFVAGLAQVFGLVCFDCQQGELRPEPVR
ncbi:hypothetical protein [Nocardia thailandica]|uniref:hypothetical protein n=1 Tax=Nocardia thailandica TaxID=257275 RepID=UPI0012FBFC02|nr:hypothetical protein [Nocardia thailandica]